MLKNGFVHFCFYGDFLLTHLKGVAKVIVDANTEADQIFMAHSLAGLVG